MPNVGPLEIVVVLVIALLVLGPRRLPDFARSVGRGVREFRSALRTDDPEGDGALRPSPDFAEDDDERARELAERERQLEQRERELEDRELARRSL